MEARLARSAGVAEARRLSRRLDKYPLVVISDWDFIEPEFHQAAIEYVTHGGRLLPEDRAVSYAYSDSRIRLNLAQVEIHGIIVIE